MTTETRQLLVRAREAIALAEGCLADPYAKRKFCATLAAIDAHLGEPDALQAAQPVARIDPMQDPKRPSYFIGNAADESPAEQVLRKLACWLGVGGYNAPTVDAEVFHDKIVDGVNHLVKGVQALVATPPAAGEQAAQPEYRESEPTHIHIESGGLYTVRGRGKLQAATLVSDMEALVAYQGVDGRWWFRPAAEFNERFKRTTATPPAAGEQAAAQAREYSDEWLTQRAEASKAMLDALPDHMKAVASASLPAQPSAASIAGERSPDATHWTITAPDGRTWTGESPVKAAAAAQRDTIDPVLAMQRINEMVAEETAIREAELAEAFERGMRASCTPINELVDRFLRWPLPKGFNPDCGISFDGRKDDEWNKDKTWPTGTNLLSGEQAQAMFEYVLARERSPAIDSTRLDFLERECATLECTSAGEDDVYWRVIDYQMAAPKEREVGRGGDPRGAIDAAMFGRVCRGPIAGERSPDAQAIKLWHEDAEAHKRISAFEWFASGILAAEQHHGIVAAPPAAQAKGAEQ